MRLTCGTDLVSLPRIEKSLQNPRFLTRVFSHAEQDAFAANPNPLPSIAASFAAKEAFSKVLGTGIRGFALAEVEVLRDPLGKPYYRLSGRALQRAGGARLSLSLSHTGDYALAFAVGYWETEE